MTLCDKMTSADNQQARQWPLSAAKLRQTTQDATLVPLSVLLLLLHYIFSALKCIIAFDLTHTLLD